MKVKIGTVLDERLIRRTRLVASREGKRLNQVIEEALENHLDRKSAKISAPIAARTAGSIHLPKAILKKVLRDEPGLLDS